MRTGLVTGQGGIVMKKAGILILLLFLLLTAPPYQSHSKKFNNHKDTDSTGSISVVVECLTPGTVIGEINIFTSNYDFRETVEYPEECTEVIFNNIPEGSIFVVYSDHGYIAIGEPVQVDILPGEITHVTLEIPFVVFGMPCSVKLEMGLEGYLELIYSHCRSMALAQEDELHMQYGICIEQRNDEILNSLSLENNNLILAIRGALARFHSASCWAVAPGVNTIKHFTAPAYPRREEFIAELIELISTPLEVESEDLQRSLETLNAIELLPDGYEESFDQMNDGYCCYDEIVQELRDAILDVFDAIDDLPDFAQIEVTDFIKERYSGWGLHISLDHS